VVLAGALSNALEDKISRDSFLQAIRGMVPEKAVDDNVKAFELGEKA